MKIKRNGLIILIIGVLIVGLGIISPIVFWNNYAYGSPSTGIIGGADAPTYTYMVFNLFGGFPLVLISFGAGLVVSSAFCFVFHNTVLANCTVKTSLIALVLSGVGASGLGCALVWLSIVSFGQTSKYPIEYPVSILLGTVCFLIFIVLIALYLKIRKANRSVKGFIIDVMTSLIFLPAFFFGFSFLYNIVS